MHCPIYALVRILTLFNTNRTVYCSNFFLFGAFLLVVLTKIHYNHNIYGHEKHITMLLYLVTMLFFVDIVKTRFYNRFIQVIRVKGGGFCETVFFCRR